ncbi:hypothetical protein [Streptomyces sp. NBC_00690]|uniref:hypothetical protein n=1 Tax=Streptomyces sp. NBC_00690 TaxID=2975808 RepID=UPI002E28ADAA|nr:hypothetical protein [Streptomyces sp. NBC_00690]
MRLFTNPPPRKAERELHHARHRRHTQSPAALLTAAAIPLALAVADAIRLRRRLAAAGRDRLTGALRRENWTPRAQRPLDRHHDQAVVLICTGDPLKLMRLFGITAQTAMRYVAAAYPERTARLPPLTTRQLR